MFKERGNRTGGLSKVNFSNEEVEYFKTSQTLSAGGNVEISKREIKRQGYYNLRIIFIIALINIGQT
jgi:hypothetical protein